MSDKGKGTVGEEVETSRRSFLKLAAAAPAAAAATVAAGGASAAEAVEAPSSMGLNKTEHVKKYLESARF